MANWNTQFDSVMELNRELPLFDTFDADVESWIDASSGTGSISHNASGHLNVTDTGAGEGIAQKQLSGLAVNGIYLLSFDTLTNADGEFRVGTTANASDILNQTALAIGSHRFEFTTTQEDPHLSLHITGANTNKTVGFDNIRIVRISR